METSSDLDAVQRQQLEAIETVDRAAQSADGRAWLRGGWAMDFCLGRITRPHTDVDVFVEISVHLPVVTELITAGWALDDRLPVEQQADLTCEGIDLSLNPVVEADGRPFLGPGPWEGQPFPADMLEHAGRSKLKGVEASHISPMAQIEFKLMTRTWQPDLRYRPKDEGDVALLCHHMFHETAEPARR